MNSLSQINHVVVLMLENRSFDSLLGGLYPKSPEFDGLDGTEFNLDDNGTPVPVWSEFSTTPKAMTVPCPDPGELWLQMNQQIFGQQQPPFPAANMSGFVKSYQQQAQIQPQTDPRKCPYDPRAVMHFYTVEQVPVISKLARQFAVSDRWHASAPCQTWPNRFFMHTGTANGYENNSPSHFPYEMQTIFNLFHDAGQAWKIYFQDIPQSLTLAKLWPHLDHFAFFGEFEDDARHGRLPAYSFIEPRYFTDIRLPDDMHPPHNVTLGEQLIARVYNALRGGKNWTETLLIITFDEHGGCYDHVPPPPAVPPGVIPPGRNPPPPFNFDRYGVRIPTVLVSPYIPQSTVLRPPGATPFDHTSTLKMLRNRFNLGPALTDRDASAPDPSDVLSLPTPDNLGPPSLTALTYTPTTAEVATALLEPLNDMQEALLHLAANLPNTATHGSAAMSVFAHLEALRAGLVASPGAEAAASVANAATLIRNKLAELFANV